MRPHVTFGALLAAVAALTSAACSIPEGEYFGRVPDPDPTHFTWCNTGEPEFLDPAMASSTGDVRIVYELFDGLTTFDPQALPAPSLATRWEISPDLRRFTFHLRDDARWSNGRRLTAADFVFSIARVLHPLTGSANAEHLWRLRHGRPFSAGTARLVLRDAGGLRAGEVVAVTDEKAPSSNLRRARAPLPLRAAPETSADVWLALPAGAELTVVELGGPGCGSPRELTRCDWAYVHHATGYGIYGWVPLAALDAPHDTRVYEVRSLEREATASLPGSDLLHLPEILGVRALDDTTLILETEGPAPILVDVTLSRVLRPVPREVVSRWPRRWVRPEHIVTSGPFHLEYWRERDKLELVKSPTFWGAAAVRLERVTITSMNETSASLAVYYQGGCDAMVSNSIPASVLPVVAGEATAGPATPRKDYIRAAYNGTYFYVINVQRYPNVHFRRALVHALDRSVLPVLLKGGQIPHLGLTPGQPIASLSEDDLRLCGVTRATPGVAMIVETGKICYVTPPGPRHDEAAARRELELARAEMGSLPPIVTIKFNSGFDYHKTIAEWIQHEWQRVLGLRVELESQEFRTYLRSTLNKEYDIARLGWTGDINDPESQFLSIFRCDSPDNRTGYCNREVERLFDAALVESDRGRRVELIRQAEAIMIAEAPIIPMYVYTQHHLQKPYVRNLHVNLSDHQSLRDVWIDPDWKRR